MMMKSTTTPPLFILFLLSGFISHLPSTTLADPPVLDTQGNPLQNGGTYYILPAFGSPSFGRGGIGTATTGNETCPLTVVQERSLSSKGLPLEIRSSSLIPVILEGSLVEISFADVPTCAPTPSKWTVVDTLSEERSVKLTGSHNAIDGWFGVEKFHEGYRFIFCTDFSSTGCSYVELSHDNDGNWPLVVPRVRPLTPKFYFLFEKVDSSSSLAHKYETLKSNLLRSYTSE